MNLLYRKGNAFKIVPVRLMSIKKPILHMGSDRLLMILLFWAGSGQKSKMSEQGPARLTRGQKRALIDNIRAYLACMY